MRTLTRKLLSLLLAFTMVCAMVPAAMAADEEGWSEWTGGGPQEPVCTHTNVKTDKTKEATCTETGTETQTCLDCNATRTRTIPALDHDWSGWTEVDKKQHSRKCSRCGISETTDHSFGEWAVTTPATCVTEGTKTRTCKDCGYAETEKLPIDPDAHNWQYKAISSTEHEKWCANPGCPSATHVREAHTGTGDCDLCDYSAKASLTASGSKIDKTYKYDDEVPLRVSNVSVTNGALDVTGEYDISFDWGGDVYDDDGNEAYLDTRGSSASAWCDVVATKGSERLEYRVKWSADLDDSITVEVSVYNTGSYALGDEDIDGDDSVVDQIYDAIDDITDGDDELEYVVFSKVSDSRKGSLSADRNEEYYYDDGDLDDVTFTAYEEYEGEVSFGFTARGIEGGRYSGTIIFSVEEGTASAGDIIYPAKSGDDVEFDVNDFEDFWEDKYSKGSLDYVTFGSISSSRGTLVDADGDKVTSKKEYYVDPGKRDLALDGVTFEPGRNTKTTVTIDFTAHGTNNSKRDAELSGTVVILYTEKDPEAIVYSSTGKNITLDADDFLDNYKDTMGSSASNIQIQFLEVPSNGTLYYNYNERTEKGTELTSKNVANYTFSTSSRASKSIEDVTYVPDSRGRSDTVRFACYTSGGDLRYYGEVTFGQTVQNVTVNMTSTSSGVTFQASTFFNADDALLSANTISFGTPSSGTLYKNWNGTSGTRVTASDMFSYVASVTGNASISTVTYVPVAGYSGTVTIPFSAYGAAGGIVSGTVSIRVTATTPTTIFTDVPTTGSQAWAYPFINRLATAGVVSGVTPTTYGPKQTVKWGEALKMVLLGAGHPAQVEGTGSNWASGYLTYAVNNGIVSNTNINLSSNITRLEMAELAAKALGMSPASRINTGIVGPTDTTNGYVYALYNAGIVGGDSSSGQNRYNGGSTLLRDEMAKIVCGVMDNA